LRLSLHKEDERDAAVLVPLILPFYGLSSLSTTRAEHGAPS
jgi:hypothetical protein